MKINHYWSSFADDGGLKLFKVVLEQVGQNGNGLQLEIFDQVLFLCLRKNYQNRR